MNTSPAKRSPPMREKSSSKLDLTKKYYSNLSPKMLEHLTQPLFKDRLHSDALRTYSVNEKMIKEQAEMKDTSSISNSLNNVALHSQTNPGNEERNESNTQPKVVISKSGASRNTFDEGQNNDIIALENERRNLTSGDPGARGITSIGTTSTRGKETIHDQHHGPSGDEFTNVRPKKILSKLRMQNGIYSVEGSPFANQLSKDMLIQSLSNQSRMHGSINTQEMGESIHEGKVQLLLKGKQLPKEQSSTNLPMYKTQIQMHDNGSSPLSPVRGNQQNFQGISKERIIQIQATKSFNLTGDQRSGEFPVYQNQQLLNVNNSPTVLVKQYTQLRQPGRAEASCQNSSPRVGIYDEIQNGYRFTEMKRQQQASPMSLVSYVADNGSRNNQYNPMMQELNQNASGQSFNPAHHLQDSVDTNPNKYSLSMGFHQYQESHQSKNSSMRQKRLPVVKIASIMHHTGTGGRNSNLYQNKLQEQSLSHLQKHRNVEPLKPLFSTRQGSIKRIEKINVGISPMDEIQTATNLQSVITDLLIDQGGHIRDLYYKKGMTNFMDKNNSPLRMMGGKKPSATPRLLKPRLSQVIKMVNQPISEGYETPHKATFQVLEEEENMDQSPQQVQLNEFQQSFLFPTSGTITPNEDIYYNQKRLYQTIPDQATMDKQFPITWHKKVSEKNDAEKTPIMISKRTRSPLNIRKEEPTFIISNEEEDDEKFTRPGSKLYNEEKHMNRTSRSPSEQRIKAPAAYVSNFHVPRVPSPLLSYASPPMMNTELQSPLSSAVNHNLSHQKIPEEETYYERSSKSGSQYFSQRGIKSPTELLKRQKSPPFQTPGPNDPITQSKQHLKKIRHSSLTTNREALRMAEVARFTLIKGTNRRHSIADKMSVTLHQQSSGCLQAKEWHNKQSDKSQKSRNNPPSPKVQRPSFIQEHAKELLYQGKPTQKVVLPNMHKTYNGSGRFSPMDHRPDRSPQEKLLSMKTVYGGSAAPSFQFQRAVLNLQKKTKKIQEDRQQNEIVRLKTISNELRIDTDQQSTFSLIPNSVIAPSEKTFQIEQTSGSGRVTVNILGCSNQLINKYNDSEILTQITQKGDTPHNRQESFRIAKTDDRVSSRTPGVGYFPAQMVANNLGIELGSITKVTQQLADKYYGNKGPKQWEKLNVKGQKVEQPKTDLQNNQQTYKQFIDASGFDRFLQKPSFMPVKLQKGPGNDLGDVISEAQPNVDAGRKTLCGGTIFNKYHAGNDGYPTLTEQDRSGEELYMSPMEQTSPIQPRLQMLGKKILPSAEGSPRYKLHSQAATEHVNEEEIVSQRPSRLLMTPRVIEPVLNSKGIQYHEQGSRESSQHQAESQMRHMQLVIATADVQTNYADSEGKGDTSPGREAEASTPLKNSVLRDKNRSTQNVRRQQTGQKSQN